MKINSLPAYYKIFKKSLHGTRLVEGWFEQQFIPKVTAFNRENGLHNSVLLIIDNAPSDPEEMELFCGDIKAFSLPRNVTSILQLMDQCVLQVIKEIQKNAASHFTWRG